MEKMMQGRGYCICPGAAWIFSSIAEQLWPSDSPTSNSSIRNSSFLSPTLKCPPRLNVTKLPCISHLTSPLQAGGQVWPLALHWETAMWTLLCPSFLGWGGACIALMSRILSAQQYGSFWGGCSRVTQENMRKMKFTLRFYSAQWRLPQISQSEITTFLSTITCIHFYCNAPNLLYFLNDYLSPFRRGNAGEEGQIICLIYPKYLPHRLTHKRSSINLLNIFTSWNSF